MAAEACNGYFMLHMVNNTYEYVNVTCISCILMFRFMLMCMFITIIIIIVIMIIKICLFERGSSTSSMACDAPGPEPASPEAATSEPGSRAGGGFYTYSMT